MGLNGKQLLDDFKEDEAYGVTKEPEPSYDDSSSDDGDNAWKYLSVGDIKGWADYTNRNYNYRSIPYVGQIIGHAADAATQGIADVAQFVGADGVGDYLNEKAQEGEAELPAMSTPELSLAYLTDPNGLASAFGMMAGSMVSMAPAAAILPELLPARAAAALGRIPTALSAVPKVGGTLEKVAPMAGRWALTGPVEAMMEGGNTEREMLQNGATPEEARQAARDVFAENVGLLTATNALEGGLIGKLKINTPRFANPVLNTASRVAGYAPTTAAEMALQGYEEGAQQGIQNGVEGESPNTAAQILNPMNWTDDQWNAAKLGIAGAVPLMGAMGAIRHFSNGGGSNAASDMLNEAQADINADEAQQAQTVAQQAAQDMQANPYQAPDVQLDTAPIDTGMDVNADTGAASTGTSYDASVLEGDPQYTISDEVSSTDVTPLTDEKMRLLDAAYYQQFGRHLYITSMKRNGDGSSWHDSGQAFDTADDNLEGNADARAWLINKGAELGLVALDEYEHPSAHATGGHIHFSDHGDPLGDNVGISSEDAGTDGGVDLSNLPVGNIAMAISQNTGLPANLIWAQLAHESADGTSQLAQEDHNYGGVKGTDGNYLHFDNDQQFIDYMSNYYPKYREDGIFEAKNADEWAEALKHGGYFTAGLDEYEGGMKRHLAEAGLSENAMSGGRARGGKGSSNGNSAAPDLSTTFDIDADNDGMRDMFSGFASEWSKYANDQKGVNFFGNMFDADGNFEDTPENRIAILEKYGKEFQQYADSQMNQTLDERVNAAINQAVADKDLNRMNALTAAKQAHDTAAMSKLVGPEKRQHFDVGKALAQAKAQRVKTNASTQQAQPQEQTQAAPVQNPAPETTPYGAALFNAQAKELPTEPIARIGALAAMAEDARLMGNMQAHDAVKQEMNRYAQANGISSDLKLDQLPEDQQLAYMQAIYEQKARTAQAVRAMATNETPENLANLDKHINSMQVAAAQIRNMRAQMKQATPTQQAQAPTPTKAKPVPPANQVTDVDPNSHFDINKIEATQKALKAEQAASSAKAKSYMNDADKIVSRYQAGKFDANDSIHQLENLKKKANNDYAESTAFRAVQTDVGGYMIIGTKRGAFAEADTLTPAETVLFAAYGGTEFSGGKLKTDIGEALAKKYNISTDEATALTAKAKPEEKQRVFLNDEETFANLESALGLKPSKKASGKDEVSNDNKLFKKADADEETKLKAEIDKLAAEFNKEASKLSANPMFNPKIYEIGAKLGIAYVRLGYTKFKPWAEALADKVGDSVKPWLDSIWNGIRALPTDAEFNETTFSAVVNYCGNRYEAGMTSFEEIFADFDYRYGDQYKDMNGEEGYNSFKDYLHAAFIAMDTRMNPENYQKEETENGEEQRTSGGTSGRPESVQSGTAGVSEGEHEGRHSDVSGEVSGRGGREREADVREHEGADSKESRSGEVRTGRGVEETAGKGAGTGTGEQSASLTIAQKKPSPTEVPGHDYEIKGTEKKTESVRYKQNIAAIKMLKELEADNRMPTPSEQDILGKYNGWGGMGKFFKEGTKENKELKDLLTPEEYAAARSTINDAFYTDPDIVKAVWKGVSRLGFKGGRVLDPSMGIGNFFGCMPRDMMQKSRLHGVEIDSLTSRFSKMLYPSAYVENKPFQKAKTADNYFDLVISNIPFGDLKIDGYNIHNYFFASGIDKVRPGGLMVFITSQGSLAGGTDAARMRKYLAGRADMIAAYKMPSGTFANAGTSVGTDIVIFRKRDVDNHQSPYAQNFVNVDDHIGIINGKPEHMGYIGYSMNTYFKDHPENILGTLGEGKNQFGEYVLQVTPKKGTSIAQSLEKAMNKLPQDIYTPITRTNEKAFNTVEANKQARLDEKTRDYEFFIKDGKAYQRQADQAVPVEKNIATVKDYIKLKNTMNALMAAQMNPKATDKQLAALRKMLNKDYDSFVAKHGNLNGKAQYAFRDDPSAGMVMALEKNVKTTGRGRSIKVTSADKAEIFTQRTVQAVRDVKTAKTPSDALVASLVNKGYVDVGYMSKLLNEKESSIVAALKGKIFKDPITEDYVTREEYLSGNVRQKLAQAEEAAKADKSYEGNVDELKKVVPEDLVSQEIHVNMGSPWIPESDVQAFLDSFDSGLKVTFIRDAAKWYVKGASWRNVPKYKAEGISFMELVDCVMNNRAIEIYDGPKKDKVLDRTKTDAANVVADNLRHDFEKWLWTDKEREKRLVRYYNDNFNNLVNREYDGSHLTFPGMNKKIHMRPWQANVVWRMLQSGNTLIAHCVGAGKTFEMQAAGMEMRRLGIANKPLYCLPNNVVKQFEDDFRKLYPEAKILKLTNEDLPAVPNHEVDTKDDGRKVKRNVELSELDPKERKKILRDRAKRNRTLARIQTEDWDAIIMSHTLFERLPLTPETAASTIKEQIDTMERTIKLAKGSLETKDISNLEKKKLSLQNRLENILHTDLADIGIPFEKLGIDQIFVDEADLFKNLHYATSMERVSGLANSDANRSNDMFAKTQWLTKQNNGRGVVFATGTPISNTMAELFTMMRYLDMRGLKEKELDLFDNWIRTFADIGTGIERKPSGDGFRKVNKVKQFINMADLSKMFRKFADIKTQDDIDLDLPELKGGKPTIVKIAADPELVRYIKEDVPKRVQEMKHTKPGTKGADNMLKLTGDLRKKSLNDDKINACAEKIVQKYNDTTDVKGAQLVFCDMGVPRGVADKVTKKDMEAADLEDKLDNESTYEKLIARLVELGIPREQIAYAQSAKDRDELNEIFKKVDSGDVRVLIGSTQKMGAGTNCQHHLVALHDLDAPWRPRDLEQRHGRILRQGNQNKEVEIFNYVVQDSFDANMWEKLKNKAAIIAQAMSNDTSLRTVEDADVVTLSYAEVESAATGNPLIKKQLDLRGEVTKYNNARTQFMKQQRDAERDIAELPEQIEEQKDIIAKIDDDIKARQDTKGDNFKMEVGGKTYTAREEAQKALEAEMDKLPKEASKTIGKLGGFNVQASATLANGKKLLLVCNRAYSPSTGTVRGLENALRTIEKIRDMRQTDLERYERKLKDAQEIVKLPDQYAEKLEAAENELQEVTRQINETMVEGNGPETPNTGLDEAPTADTEAKYSIDGKPIVGRKYSLAWHGSPARFEQFDLSYMGSGEGAQAHGWGLYFAKNRETSQNRYLDRISGKDSEKTLYAVDIPEENTMLDENKSFAEQPKKVQEAIDKIIDDVPIGWLNRAIRGKSGREFDELTHKYNMWEKYTASGRAYQDRANLLRNYRDAKTDEESMRSADALYDTYEQLYDNGDEMVERYMNDEGLLNREIQSLERRAQSDFDNAAKYDKGLREDFAKSIKDGTGFDLYTRIGHMHYNIYWDYHHGFTKVNPVFEKIQKEYGFDGVSNSQWASLVLNAYGVNGITYNGGIDGRCYVVFDDKAIRIIKKYDANNPDELARQSVDDIVQQIKDTLPNTATFKQDGSRLTATMPNGAKLTFDIKDIIELKGKEAEKARAAHGIPASMPITVNGRAYTVNGNAFIELARDGKTGTAAHELTHVAYELYLTDKEKAALRKAAEKEAMLKGRDIEEEIADNVRDYYLQRKEQKLAKNYGKLMQKIIKAIQTIRDMFTGAYQAKKAMEAITSGEVWTRKANTTSDTAERFSVNPKKAIQNHFGKRAQTQNHPRNVKAMLEDLTKMKVRFGKLDPKMNVVYKKFEGVIRARNANEWETVLPEAGRAIAERLGLKPTDQMNHYIAQWLLDQTGNNRSQEALDFEAAMKKNLPISDQLIDLKTLFSDRNNREADDIVHDIIEYDQKKDPLFSKTTLAKKWRGFYDSVIEELGPVKRLVQEVEKKSGQKIGAAVNPYTAFRLYRGHYGKAMTMIEGKSEDSVKALQTVYPSVDFTGFKTIRMILDECGALHDDARLKDLLAYALACHVLDIHEKNNNVRMRQQNLQNKIAATKDKNLQKKYKKQIDDLEREIMEVPRTEDGLALTEDRCREVIKKHSAEYGQAQQDLVHFSKVTAAILYDAGVIGKKRFNELMHSYPNYIPMFRVFEDNEDVNFGDSLKHMHGSSRRVINPLESIIRNTYEFTRRAERNKARQLIANLTRISDVGEFIEEVDNKKPNDKTTITYYENGEVKYLQTDPDIVKAVNRMGQKQSNWVARFLAIPAKIARACFTTANPAFAVGNVIRDTTDATFYSKYGFKPWDFVRGFLHAIHHDEMFYEWLASGAAQASAISLDRDYTSSTLNQMTKTWKQRLLSRHALSAILDGMQMIGEYSEYGTRIAAYERARTQLAKQGAPHLPAYDLAAAALESRDLMDFARGGTGSRYMNSAIPFANAAIQGIDKTIRTFDFVHDRKNATKALVRLMLWGMLPAFALALMHRDDDWWKELPDWQKETNWIIGKVGNTIIRIPKGQDLALRFFSSLIEKAIDRSKHKAIDYARPFWDALPSFMPIAMLPPLEVITNHTFFTGGPVVPRYQQDLPAAMQYGNETSSIAKFFGKELGISPRNIEHILFGYTGNMGKGLLGLFDTLTGQRSLNTNLDEAPVISRFTVMPYKQSKTVTDFYDKYEEQNKLYREFKATDKKPKDFNPALYQRLKTSLKDMSQVNKDERAAIENPRMPANVRKAKQISFQNRRIAIARKALGADR